jgi:glucose-6-phosphate 1-dehydrogenase
MATDNPLRTGSRQKRPPEPFTMVILGATGDLTARKLVPALFSLAQEGYLPARYNIVGFARRAWDHEAFREKMYEGVQLYSRHAPGDMHQTTWAGFAANLHYISGSFEEIEQYRALDAFITDLAARRQMPDNRLYYLAAPPQTYNEVVANLGACGMTRSTASGARRIVIEKPFGHDLASAKELNNAVHASFQEDQVYRIDHYLGKETVQNILIFRFGNSIFEPVWNRRYVDHIQISVAEEVPVGSRAGYYDQAGVVRDIFQNHILQVLTLVSMEPPVAFEAGAIRDEKVKVLRAVRPYLRETVAAYSVRGQYGAGIAGGVEVPAYWKEKGVSAGTRTATYAALKLFIDNWRWQGVPFYLRSGKSMATRATEVSIHFKQPPHLLFAGEGGADMRSNVLAIRVQPDEGISLVFEAKLPGQGIRRRPVTMDFRYGASFGITIPPDAYERLLLDAIQGDATLFARADEIEWAWKLVDPILAGWESPSAPPLEVYEAGSWGPSGAEHLIERDGRRWRRL